MFARPLTKPNQQANTVAFEESRMILRGDAPHQLPQGNWHIEVTKGDAWIFCDGHNIPVHTGEQFEVNTTDGDVHVHSLYQSGHVHYTIKTML